MSDIATQILEWLNSNPELAGLFTFLISAGESVAIIGTIVPGTVMMTAIGALVGAGVIPFWSTLIWAILGAIVGDGISYWLGYYFKDRIHNAWPFSRHPELLNSGENFFRKYGGMSVFIGRFVGPVRALVPLIAGMLGVKPLRFSIANITSAILWAPIYMLPGFLMGAASTELPSEIAARAILLLILIILFIILCIWLTKKVFYLIHKEIDQFLTWIWKSLKKSRYFHLLTTILKHHDKQKTYGQLSLAFYFLITTIAFLYLANFILYKGSSGPINNMVFHLFRSLRTPGVDNVMMYITLLGDKLVIFPLVITLSVFFIFNKHWRMAAHVIGLGVLTACSIELFKYIVHSPRPWGVLSNPNQGFSFPSGHTTLSLTYYLTIALLCIKLFKIQKYRILVILPVSLLILAIIVSRLYFGVHWLTDIIGGSLLAAALIMLVILSYNRKKERFINPKGVILTVILTLLLSYTFNLYHSFNKLKHGYTMLDWPIYTIKFDSWWNQKGTFFPLYRLNRFGFSANVFNIQWVGKLDEIKKELLKNGWELSPERDWLSALYRITSVQSTEHLPLVSPIYIDKPPILILIKNSPSANKLIVLRFWTSPFLINNVQQPLWLGTIEYAPSTYSWLFKSKRSNEIKLTGSILFNAPSNLYTIKEMTVTIKSNRHNKNQNILLLKPKSISDSNLVPKTNSFDLYQKAILKQPYGIHADNSINLLGWEEYDLLG